MEVVPKNNIDLRSSIWDKHIRSKKSMNAQSRLTIQENEAIVPTLRELAVSNFEKKRLPNLRQKYTNQSLTFGW